MRILFVVSRPLEINTSASIRNRAIINGLILEGHNVDVITTNPDVHHKNYDASIENKKANIKYISLGHMQKITNFGRNINIVNVGRKVAYRLREKFQIYDNLVRIVDHVKNIDINDSMYELVISSSDPKSSHLFVDRLFDHHKIKHTPWIQIWGDPFYNDITRSNKLLDRKIKKEEERLFKHATKIIYVSKSTKLKQEELFPLDAKKMEYVPIPYLKKIEYERVNLNKDSLNFLYTGDFTSHVRNIKPLYDSINKSKHNLVICGNSDKILNDTNQVKVYERVSFEKTKELEERCDILVHLSNINGTQIPGKIYQYFGTNKPILFIYESGDTITKEVFDHFKRCTFVENNEASILNVISNFEKFNSDIDSKPLEEFDSQNIAKKIINFLSDTQIR